MDKLCALQPQRKGFFIPLAALVIDLVIGGLFYVVEASLFSEIFRVNFGARLGPLTALLWVAVLLYSSTEVFFGQTIGKAIFRLTIARADCTPAEASRLTSRWLIKTWPVWMLIADAYLSNPMLAFLGGLGATAVLVSFLFSMNDGKQAWHDQIAGTAVYRSIDVDGPDESPRGFDVIQR